MLHFHTKPKNDFYVTPRIFKPVSQVPLDEENTTSSVVQVTGGIKHSKYEIPDHGIDEEIAYNLIHNELTLDGNPHLNLASFVNTFSSPIAKRLITENINKNLADNDEYPQLIELTQRCIYIISNMWKAGPEADPIGCATTGSSEAIMLGGLAMKKAWEHKMSAAGKPIDKPNIVMSSACQVALEKFTRYFDVECRLVPVTFESHHALDPNDLWDYVDENTIGLFVIMGTTYTGHFENVQMVSKVLDEIEAKHPEWSNKGIPIHVDGASGGFIVPFSFTEEQMAKAGLDKWCFNNPRVVSINTSGHKFGLTTPGLGWVVWRNQKFLADELRFSLKYLGGVEETFGLNFSRPGFQVVHQYFNFVSLGKRGFMEHFGSSLYVARFFSHRLLNLPGLKGKFSVVSSIHESIKDNSVPREYEQYREHPELYKPGVPLVAFRFSDEFMNTYPEIPQLLLSNMLRTRGWIIPNYPLPKSKDGSEKFEVLRVVFRSEMKLDLAQLLLVDIDLIMTRLVSSYERLTRQVKFGDQSENARRAFVYNMLITVASPETPVEEEEDESQFAAKREEIHRRITRNYRGTC